jgi:hypothetical protein
VSGVEGPGGVVVVCFEGGGMRFVLFRVAARCLMGWERKKKGLWEGPAPPLGTDGKSVFYLGLSVYGADGVWLWHGISLL